MGHSTIVLELQHLLQSTVTIPTLPYHLSLLPAIARALAFVCFLPVIILALTDILGWVTFVSGCLIVALSVGGGVAA